MDITFSNNKLLKMANDKNLAIRKLGPVRAKLFNNRLDDMDAATTLEDVRPGSLCCGLSSFCPSGIPVTSTGTTLL